MCCEGSGPLDDRIFHDLSLTFFFRFAEMVKSSHGLHTFSQIHHQKNV